MRAKAKCIGQPAILGALKNVREARELGERMWNDGISEENLKPEQRRILWDAEDFERLLRRYGYHSPRYCGRYRTGPTIKALAKECGWSLRALAKASNIDRKLIRGHIKGKGISAANLERYAETFSEKLGRTVTMAEIEGS